MKKFNLCLERQELAVSGMSLIFEDHIAQVAAGGSAAPAIAMLASEPFLPIISAIWRSWSVIMGTTTAVASSQRSLASLLGGRGVLHVNPRTMLDWVSIIRNGIPSAAADSLAKTLRVGQSELGTILGIPERTLARRRREGTFNSEESAKLIRLARVIGRTEEVFEDSEAALDWLKSANASLAGATPLSLMDTDIGAESVMDTLGRIEHGVFA